MSNGQTSTLFNLHEGRDIKLNGFLFLTAAKVGQPTLKVTIDVCPRKEDDEVCLFNSNTDDWDRIEPEGIVISVGDRLLVGDVQIMLTKISVANRCARFSLRSTNQTTYESIRKAAGVQR